MRVGVKRLHSVLVAAALVALLAPMTPVAAQNENPGALPPEAHPFGATYSEWGAQWWQWVLGQGAVDPNSDATGMDCGIGQTGRVWFLAGAWGAGSVERSCTVPPGTALFFPVANSVYILFPDDVNDTPELGRQITKEMVDGVTDVRADVDGTPLTGLEAYRVQSPASGAMPETFLVTMTEDNWLGLDAGEYETVADGMYVMLTPLSVGRHTVHFHAQFAGFEEPLDVTYHITVKRH